MWPRSRKRPGKMALVLEARTLAERDVPDYIEVDDAKLTAKAHPRPGDHRGCRTR